MAHHFNPAQPRDFHGRWTAGNKVKKDLKSVSSLGRAASKTRSAATGVKNRTAVVPYARVSPRSATAGINAGTPVSKKYRLVAGGYVRVERTVPTAAESAVRKAVSDRVNKITHGNPLAKKALAFGLRRAARSSVLHTQIGLGSSGATARLGTSSSGLPSVIVRKGASKVTAAKRAAAIADYNKQMSARTVKPGRPQRRRKNP